MKVLHICNWYPEEKYPSRGIFIKRQIDSLKKYSSNDVIHFEIRKGGFFSIKKESSDSFKQIIIELPFKIWLLSELISVIWLYYTLVLKKNQYKYDVINFHIAYPLLSFWHLMKKKISKPVVISEHWSAYHYNFNTKQKLPRIQRIFKQSIPLITVSKSLYNDIRSFSNTEIDIYIVPNSVDPEVFYSDHKERANQFLMIGTWKYPKMPFLAIDAFLKFSENNPDWKLIIIGHGPLLEEMKDRSKSKVNKSIDVVGKKSPEEIADYMRKSRALLHPSDYETFSVVCAEAISCGMPVLASKVGGIPEVVDDNGLLIQNDLNSWEKGIQKISDIKMRDNAVKSEFSPQLIGEKYFKVLIEIVKNYQY